MRCARAPLLSGFAAPLLCGCSHLLFPTLSAAQIEYHLVKLDAARRTSAIALIAPEIVHALEEEDRTTSLCVRGCGAAPCTVDSCARGGSLQPPLLL